MIAVDNYALPVTHHLQLELGGETEAPDWSVISHLGWEIGGHAKTQGFSRGGLILAV